MSDTNQKPAVPPTTDLKSALGSSVECPLVGQCHGRASLCDYCGDVTRTCERAQCAVHDTNSRCGREIATTKGWRRCAGLPGHPETACLAIQSEWADKAIERARRPWRASPLSLMLSQVAGAAVKVCVERGWGLDWKERGAVLHLEASEFIEAIRGKKGIPEKEAADVLFTLLVACNSYRVNLASVVEHLAFLASGGAVESTGKDETLPELANKILSKYQGREAVKQPEAPERD